MKIVTTRLTRVRSKWRAAHWHQNSSVALAVSLAALAFGVVGALGPSGKERATYIWPPARLGSAQPERQWYSPLLLIRRQPASLDVTVPCRGIVPLPRAPKPVTLLATARYPGRNNGLLVRRSGKRGIVFSVGGETLAAIAAVDRPSCSSRLRVDGDRWVVTSPTGVRQTGDLEARQPIVSGFFTGLDLRRGARPTVALTTEPFGTQPGARQGAAWVLAVVCALFALLAISSARWPALGRPFGSVALTFARALRPPDLFVAGLLLVWWFVGPTLYDDGWVKVRQTNYDVSGGFSNYYSSYGVNLPLDYWLEWAQHWVVGRFDTLLILRLPALVLLAASWILCRWILSQLGSQPARVRRATQWALAVAFVLGALSWDVTLRPEPVISLLVVCSLACAIRFLQRPSAAPLSVAAVVVALAVTAHPAGLVAAAPQLAILPRIAAWVRANGWRRTTSLATSVSALGLVLLAVGADVPQRLADGRGIRDYGDAVTSWREELGRYMLTGASPMRRESVALMVLALVAYLVRRDRAPRPLLDLPGASLGLGMLLMIPTPSKWIWHFGVFAGFAAVAVAAELSRLVGEAHKRSPLMPFVAAGAAILVQAWALWPRSGWGDFDLRTLDWVLAVEDRVTLVKLAALLMTLGLLTVMSVQLVRRGLRDLRQTPSSMLPWLVPLAVIPVLGFTIVMFAADAVKTPAWTLARQNLDALRGNSGCGLATDTTITVPSSPQPLERTTAQRVSARPGPWTAASPSRGLSRFSILGSDRSTIVATPWYAVPHDRTRVGFFVSAAVGNEPGDVVEARWGQRVAGAIRPLSAPVQARTLAEGSCYQPGAIRQLADGRLAFHLRHIGGETRDGWAIENAGYVDEQQFVRILEGAPLLPAPKGAGFRPTTLDACGLRNRPRIPTSPPSVTAAASPIRSVPHGTGVKVPSSDTVRTDTISWTFLPEGRLPVRPPKADAVQLILRSEADPPRAVAATGAVAYRDTSLERLLRTADAPALLTPNLVLLMPCNRLPRLRDGIVQVPSVVVSRSGLWPIEFETSPFHGLLDLYTLRDLSVGDSEFEPEGMHVYWIDRNIPGTAVAYAARVPAESAQEVASPSS